MRKINYIAVGIILTLATISSCSSKTDEITNINIIYNNEIVDSLNKTKDEIFTLSLDVFSTNKDYKVGQVVILTLLSLIITVRY